MGTGASEQDERRVSFMPPLAVTAMTIDGTWRVDGLLKDISDSDARIELTDYAADLSEFFLLLTTFGNPVFRRCKRRWINGAQMGVSFVKSSIGIQSSSDLPRSAP
jgi:hypothetical protein